MAKRNREINIFNIAFLDVITGAMGAFVLMVLLLAPYYTGASVETLKNQKDAQSAVDRAQKAVQQAQQAAHQSGGGDASKRALDQARANLEEARKQLDALKQQLDQLTAQNKRLKALDDRQQQQLDAAKQQNDQLSAENKRSAAVNDQRQQQLKQAQDRIAQLEQQAAQATKEALDRAEQNMRQADQAVQTGDIEALKRLLAQARADLAAARSQLAQLQQELDQTQTALRKAQDENAALQDQLNKAQQIAEALTVENQALKRQLDEAKAALATAQNQIADLQAKLVQATAAAQEAQQERDKAVAALQQAQQERDKAVAALQQAQHERDTAIQQRDEAAAAARSAQAQLAKSAPIPDQWVELLFSGLPTCEKTDFTLWPDDMAQIARSYGGFGSKREQLQFQRRATEATIIAPIGSAQHGQFNGARPFERAWILPIVGGAKELIGLQALTPPPANCAVTFGVSWTFTSSRGGGGHVPTWATPGTYVVMRDTRPVLFTVIPPFDVKDVDSANSGLRSPRAVTAEDIAQWTKDTDGKGIGPTVISRADADGLLQAARQAAPPQSSTQLRPQTPSQSQNGASATQEKH